MIQFIKEIYFTGFAIIFNSSHASGRTSGAITAITVIEWLILAGIASWIDISIGTRFFLSSTNSLFLSKLMIAVLFSALFFANYRVLVVCGHGIKFAHEFRSLKKGRKVLLITGFCSLTLFTLIFFVGARMAYRHVFHIES
jgi:hypothetical protein